MGKFSLFIPVGVWDYARHTGGGSTRIRNLFSVSFPSIAKLLYKTGKGVDRRKELWYYSSLEQAYRPKDTERKQTRETDARLRNGAPCLLVPPALPPAARALLSGLGVGAAKVRHQLRADRQQPAGPDAGGGAPAVDEREQGEALRRGPQGADGVRQHRRGVHHRRGQREPPDHGDQPRRRPAVGVAARAALHPGHPHHLHHRRQRGVRQQRHDHGRQPRARHAGRARCARGGGAERAGDRLVGALGRRARQQLPAVVGRVPGELRAVHQAAAGLPQQDRLALLLQRVPVLRLQGGPEQRVAAVRPVPAERRRARRRAGVRQHAVRADRRGVRGDEGDGAHGHRREDLGDRVAVEGGRGRGGRQRAERGGLQREPHAAGRHEPGDAAQAERARGRVRVRDVQREHEARAGVGEELRAVLPERVAGVHDQRRRRRVHPRVRRRPVVSRAVRPVLDAVHVLLRVQIGGKKKIIFFDATASIAAHAVSTRMLVEDY